MVMMDDGPCVSGLQREFGRLRGSLDSGRGCCWDLIQKTCLWNETAQASLVSVPNKSYLAKENGHMREKESISAKILL